MRTLFLTLAALLVWLVAETQMTIVVSSSPQLTPLFDSIYIAGSFNNWNPGDEAYRLQPGPDGLAAIIDATPGQTIEFKFTRGNWARVEGSSSGGYISNRSLIFENDQVVPLSIEGWEDLPGSHSVTSQVRILDSNMPIPQLGRTRRVWIRLPDGYEENITTSYPVLYLQDGQNIFDVATSFAGEWQVDESLEAAGLPACSDAIVVAIDNGGVHRIDEYAPWYNNEYNEGGEGSAYSEFVITTLKPFIDEHFRTLSDRNNTAVGGSSLGALISLYMMLEYPDVVSRAVLLSPAYWFNEEEITALAAGTALTDCKIYQVAGSSESASMIPLMEEVAADLISAGLPSQNIVTVSVPDGAHSEWFWAQEFTDAFLYILDCTSGMDERTIVGLAYPNPASDTLHLDLAGLREVKLFDLNGQLLLQQDSPDRRHAQIDVRHLASGLYIVTLQAEGQMFHLPVRKN